MFQITRRFFAILGPQFKCVAGQGEEGKGIEISLDGISLDECKEACVEFNGCFGIDYSNTDTFSAVSSCRLYGLNEPRMDAGNNHRSYCALLGKRIKID